MVIAVYVDLKSYGAYPVDLYFIKGLLQNLASNFPDHKYYLIQPDAIYERGGEFDYFSFITLRTNQAVFYSYRVNSSLLKTLKMLKADLLFSVDAVFKTDIDQTLLLTSLSRKPKLNSEKLRKVKSVFVSSQQLKDQLQEKYALGASISMLYGGASKTFEPLDDEMKSLIKEKYTEGKEYFVYRGRVKEENNIISLLKAFSLFKKRQKSTMKLVLMGKIVWQENDFSKLMSNYKYRDDVVRISDEILSEEANVLAAAYALVQPYPMHNVLFSFDAMQCAVPVLAANGSTLKEITSDGALFFDSTNDADIADKMMLIYKDEGLRSQLIENGHKLTSQYQWKKTIEIVAQYLQ
jgi:glycosyltransferase involved in cell wall biosynthesis